MSDRLSAGSRGNCRRSAGIIAGAVLVTAILSPVLQGCTPTIATGAAVGIAAVEERGLGGTVTDAEIRVRINELWFASSETLLREVRLQVHSRRVLLSGKVSMPAIRDEAVRLAWQAKRVKEVINEIQVGDSDGVIDFVKDNAISGALRVKLLADPGIRSLNYSVETSAGTIYLLGIAQSRDELDRVINHARTIKSVRKVVSHVIMKQDL